MHIARLNFQEFVKERPVVDHRLTHFFRAGFAPLPSQRECPRDAVILNDYRMINRQVVRTLIEIFEGIATRDHHLRDEVISFAHGSGWVVDKARLNTTPFAGERIGLISSELAQVEAADTLSTLPERGFSTRRADSLNGSFVLGSKALAQVDALAPARVNPSSKPDQQDDHARTDEHEGL
jgi:hypothetical protein